MLKIKIKVGGDHLEVEGEVSFADLVPQIDKWYGSLDAAVQRQIDMLTAQAKADNDALASAVAKASP